MPLDSALSSPGGYIARLDKATEQRVLCGYPTCPGQLAIIVEWDIGVRELVMEPGWRLDSHGVWKRIRWLEGRERAGFGSDSRYRRGRVLKWSDAVAGSKGVLAPAQHGIPVFSFPVKAACPRCKHVNTLLAVQLRVVTEEERAARLGHNV